MDNGWEASAASWIKDMGQAGDHGRDAVLDAPMLERLQLSGARDMVDIGCGEGRFCRMARDRGVKTTGIDPTEALLEQARALDPGGSYHKAVAEKLPLPEHSTDLVVFYLTFIDIPDIASAISEATRVLRPGGRILIANLSSFITAAQHDGWTRHEDGSGSVHFRKYLEESVYWTHWRGIRIQNWHRPTAFYMRLLLDAGLHLTHFDEPPSTHPDDEIRKRYNNVAYFTLMEWQKPV